MNTQEILLLEIKNGGGIKAYEKVFKQYYKSLMLESFYILKDEMEAEDLVQSFFLEAWERNLLSNINSALKSYLHLSIRNRSLNFLSRKKTEEKKVAGFLESKSLYFEDNSFEEREGADRLKTLLNGLTKQRLEVVNLIYLEDKKYQEAADIMGLSINSIKTHLKIAIKELRVRLNVLK